MSVLAPIKAPPIEKFIDISSNNFGNGKSIDFGIYWGQGYRWLCVKRSEGTSYYFDDSDGIINSWHRRGGHVIHYHWLRPEVGGSFQAERFVRIVKKDIKPGDKVMLDVEASYNYSTGQQVSDGGDEALAKRIRDFAAYVAEYLPGVELLIYTGNWYVDRFGDQAAAAAIRAHRVILSEYTGAKRPDNRYGFKLAAYQWTDHANVPGVNHPVDCNMWIGPVNIDQQPKPKPVPPAPKHGQPDPQVNKRFHIVRYGDTLGGIAHEAGINLPKLYALNRFRHPRLRQNQYHLQVNWKIRIH